MLSSPLVDFLTTTSIFGSHGTSEEKDYLVGKAYLELLFHSYIVKKSFVKKGFKGETVMKVFLNFLKFEKEEEN